MASKWLSKFVPGFDSLSNEEREAIFGFTLLWSLFEDRILDNRAQADRIRAKVNQWREEGMIDVADFEGALTYFRHRYYANTGFTQHFAGLRLRPNDQPEIVKAVLSGDDGEASDKLLTVLMIIWRFRNNLFHGEKWAYQFQDQLSNFTHANDVLMQLLERYG